MGFLVKKYDFFLKNHEIHEKVGGFGVNLRGNPTISILMIYHWFNGVRLVTNFYWINRFIKSKKHINI